MRRRTFLGGAATLIALPWLEALAPRRAEAAEALARRLLVYYVPNGIEPAHWIPASTGSDYELPPALSSLAPLRRHVLLASGLANAPADLDDGHLCGTASLLTCTPIPIREERLENGVSLDQLAVQTLRPETRWPSLQLGLEPGLSVGGCGLTPSCAFGNTISWSSATTPLPVIVEPRVVFERLFAGLDAGETERASIERKRRKRSILDLVREDARALQARISTRDRQRIEEYLEGLRAIELRLDAGKIGECSVGAPEELPQRMVQERWRAMNDLMVAAFQCDLTRFITFMSASSASGRSFEFLGVGDGHHELSHHDDKPEKLDALETIARFEVEQFAYVVERLAQIDEGDGSALDHSILIFTSELGDGSRHSHSDLPIIVAGGGGGTIRPGRHVRFPEKEPLANFHLTLLRALGVAADRFGADGTRTLGELGA